MSGEPLLQTRDLTKVFGTLTANDRVSLTLGRGEIVALLGENGAGKSTLVKMLFGTLQPDAGDILWRGAPVAIGEPAAARRLGIGMVHQHFSLFEAFTAAQNIALGLPDQPMAGLAERAARTSRAYGLPLDPHALVADLSVGERQRIEIVRCLLQDPTLVIMDEPTSVLTPQEAERLFVTLRALKEEGRTVLYISHKLEEVRALCDRAVVMRAGRVVGEYDPGAETAASLAAAMVGGEVPAVRPASVRPASVPALEVRRLEHPCDRPFGVALRHIDLTVHTGEVVGIAGMAGNGQGELFEVLSGEARIAEPAAVAMFGAPAGGLGIDARRRLGAAFVPEERLGHAAVPSLDLAANVLVSRHARNDGTVARLGLLRPRACRALARRIVARMDVRSSGEGAPAAALSGGNLQKFVVGRELDARPRLLVIDQPTWGVDAGAAANIRQAIVDLAAQGTAVLVISQDLDELFEVADRIAVMASGRLSAPHGTRELTREAVGLMMGGVHRDTAPSTVAGAPIRAASEATEGAVAT